MTGGVVMAASSDPASFTSLIQFGVLGIILALVLRGYLWPKPSVDHLVERAVKAEEQRDELVDVYQDQIIPLLVEVKDKMIPALQANTEAVTDMSRILNGVKSVIEAMDGHRPGAMPK